MAKKSLLAMALVFLVTLVDLSAWAAPLYLNYQGRLVDRTSGEPIDGTVEMTFGIYDGPNPIANILWAEIHYGVSVDDGIYNVHLGSGTTITGVFDLDLFADDNRWLEVMVNGELLTPRQQCTSVAYSLSAADADTLDGLDSSEFAGSSHDHSFGEITGTATDAQIPNNITINNAATADYAATADSADYATTAGDADTLDGLEAAAFGQKDGTLQFNLNADYVNGFHAWDFAWHTHEHDMADIATGQLSTDRYSAFLDLSAEGYLNNDSGNIALNNGTLQDNLNADMLDGLQADHFAWSDHGHHSLSAADGNPAQAVYVDNAGDTLIGSTSKGIRMRTSGDLIDLESLGTALVINNNSGQNTIFHVAQGNVGIGTWAPSSKLDVNGDVEVTGDVEAIGDINSDGVDAYWGAFYDLYADYLEKGGGDFRIDHPLDPENKYLRHSFVESPDRMNVYNGNLVLDANGEAWVELPEWFGALNRDFRYQLTCIGDFAPVYIAEKIANNRFKIAGGTPNMEVSWQVTGIRQDPWAIAHPVVVEEEKPEEKRGYYLRPDLYGQPEERKEQR
jgi:hypothetical protein